MEEVDNYKPPDRTLTAIRFVKQGEEGKGKQRSNYSILDKTQSWEMKVDLERKLVYPDIVETTLRPDIVMSSQQSKLLITIELTVPWEEGCEKAHQRKKTKYDELMTKCRDKGWTAWLFLVEVGCRGFPAPNPRGGCCRPLESQEEIDVQKLVIGIVFPMAPTRRADVEADVDE